MVSAFRLIAGQLSLKFFARICFRANFGELVNFLDLLNKYHIFNFTAKGVTFFQLRKTRIGIISMIYLKTENL